ncbi:3'(2'),5'-bisphosphate nucleotidase CysQ [Chitiniphilus purpureus]|uniref:3'(2'),5'-bisphosphate nucleotidase CysQ n=1 Tax=Chitiniphilus purpureus TaxID=2981137 RepID=A0ABY6DH74_9NEIS|nr:3'(2'),5'-bisphosphate nucleotidase CysQ [Chitiniphilus sp. CD1]UXY13700.1 3'(2'),5'-bisphosphate nucleotidase CysQ [Chitiniphilus sp. CD1]
MPDLALDHLRLETELVRIAREAGAAILDIYARADFGVEAKGDGSPLTLADLAANRVILNGLAACFPWPVISEETLVDYEARRDWATFWLVDPLDGTRDFLDRNDEFTVNIGLIHQGVAIAGVVYAPALDELYYGASGQGAWMARGDVRIALPGRWALEHALACSRHHDVPQTAAFASLNGVARSVPIGSALKFGRLAAGEVDLYPRFNGSSEWDVAAGDAVLRAAGCTLRALPDLTPMRYNTPSQRNPHFIAAAPHVPLDQLSYPT